MRMIIPPDGFPISHFMPTFILSSFWTYNHDSVTGGLSLYYHYTGRAYYLYHPSYSSTPHPSDSSARTQSHVMGSQLPRELSSVSSASVFYTTPRYGMCGARFSISLTVNPEPVVVSHVAPFLWLLKVIRCLDF